MKSYGNLYEKILNKENIRQAILDVSKHRTTKKNVQKMLQNIDSVIENIYNLLNTNSFKPSNPVPNILSPEQIIKSGFWLSTICFIYCLVLSSLSL